jgi:hypothetical protein
MRTWETASYVISDEVIEESEKASPLNTTLFISLIKFSTKLLLQLKERIILFLFQ